MGRVTNGAWDGTSTQPPFNWGIDDSADRTTLILDISSLAAPASVSVDVTSIVTGWVNGTIDNFGLAVFVDRLESNAAGFSNPQLIVMNALDTDGDGLPDNYEISNGLDPNFDDSGLDNDSNGESDGLTNLEEFNLGTDPQDSDTDDDGLSDGEEVNGTLNPWLSGVQTDPPGDPTDPRDADSDGDSVDDRTEIVTGTNPNVPDGAGQPVIPFVDTDLDSYRDEAELAFGSDPNDPASIPDHRPPAAKPNVVIIYADDLGFGDISAYGNLYGTLSSAPTPNIDALAASGVMFTQGHSANGVCTPSRYSLLTGRYNWRLFNGFSSNYGNLRNLNGQLPQLSDVTIAEYLKTQQYDTAALGKWHLGGSIYNRNGSRITNNPSESDDVDWERRVDLHATDNGFDTFRGNAMGINFAPYTYMVDDRMQFFDTTLNGGEGAFRPALNTDQFRFFTRSELNSTVIGARGSRDGLGDPSYTQVGAGPQLVRDAEEYFADRASSGDTDPFFAYVSMHSPHRPWAVTPEFRGADTARGFVFADWMREVDSRVGRIIAAIDNNGFGENTVVIFTSDNGPETDMTRESIEFGADSNSVLRGHKRESYEGGTRVPFFVRWPGQAAAGMIVTEPISQVDIFATIAAYLGQELPDTSCPDGESFLNLIRGQAKPVQRQSIVLSTDGGQLSLKTHDSWKFIDGTGGGYDISFTPENVELNERGGPDQGIEGIDRGVPKQLYELPVDIGEVNNLIASVSNDTDISNELTAITGRDLLGQLNALRSTISTRLFPRAPDNDGDQMPNAFELANGLDPDFPLDAASDLDGDGVSNLDEFNGDTDPNDPNDPPAPFLLGDVNRSGAVDFLDISPFVALLSAGEFQDEADINRNGVVNFLDIGPFVRILSGQ